VTVTVQSFRASFREFKDPDIYADEDIALWLGFSASLVNIERWNADGGNLADLGVSLVIAHHLVLAERDRKAAAVGGIPGTMTGPQSAKSVDKVSVTYDASAVKLDDAGFWALTSYGMRFLTMGRLIGAGAIQLGGGGYGPGPYGAEPLGFS
jgi:hypothetical protein